MSDEWEEYEKVLQFTYEKALADIIIKILELRPHYQYLSSYHEGQLDLCDNLLDYIESLKKNAN